MTTLMTPPAEPAWRRLVAAAGGVLLALAAASAGLWQIIEHAGRVDTTAGRAEVAVTPAAVRGSEGVLASDQEMYQQWRQRALTQGIRPAGVSGADARLTIFFVGSPAQAEQVRAGLDRRDEIFSYLGQALLAEEVVVVDSAADELRIRQGIDESDTVRAQLYLPPATVIDLRTP